MHILLTDRLCCPRCGPRFGLVLLADRIENRRVLEGRLGCSNCREQYAVSGGGADLRTGPTQPDEARDYGDATEAAIRIAALLGVTPQTGQVLIAGPGAALAGAVSALMPELEVIAITARPTGCAATAEEDAGVSRIAAGAVLPFHDGILRAAALTGGGDSPPLAEALRVLAPGGRLVLDPAPAGAADALREAGAEVLLDQDEVVVATVPGPLR
jgi:uncharacterized protein YbaR (Trm112 family)